MSTITGRKWERACDACTVCCTALPIETREFRKLPGVACRHLNEQGCAIHAQRYSVCRAYSCGWQQLDWLDETWRPDLCGVLISLERRDLPPDYEEGLEFLVVGGEAAMLTPAFAQAIATAISKDFATFLAVPGPAKHFSARVLLNDMVAGFVSRGDEEGLGDFLRKILRSAEHHCFEPMSEA